MNSQERCGCDESLRLRAALARSERDGDLLVWGIQQFSMRLARSQNRLARRRLEVLELKLRARSVELRYQHVSAIPELAVAQKVRRDRNRERLVAVMALRSFAG